MKPCSTCETRLGAEDLFCPKCGMEQPSSPKASPSHGEPAVSNPQPASEPITEIETEHQPPVAEPEPATKPVSTSSFPAVASECSDLIVQYDASRVFLEEMTMPFRFMLIPQADDLSKLSIEVCTQCGIRAKKRVMRTLREGVPRELSLDLRIPEGRSGLLTFDVSVRYRRGGKTHLFESSRRGCGYRRRFRRGTRSIHRPKAENFLRI